MSTEHEQNPTPAAAAAAELIARRTPPHVRITLRVVAPDTGPTGEVWQCEGPMGAVGPYRQVSPPRQGTEGQK